MENSVRGQIAFRKSQGYSAPVDARHSRIPADKNTYYLGVGILECDKGAYQTESIIDFTVSDSHGGPTMDLGTKGAPLDSAAASIDSLSGLITSIQIKAPFLGALLTCGGMVLRETRFPSPEGKVTLALIALVRSPVDHLPERTMFTLSGDAGSRLRMVDPVPMPGMFPIGCALCQVYADPIWGFGPEPRSIHSTLRLDFIDAFKEYEALLALDDPDAGQRARIEALRRTEPGRMYDSNLRDPAFAEFKRIMRAEGLVPPMDAYPTASEIAATEAAAGRVIREIFEAQSRGPRI